MLLECETGDGPCKSVRAMCEERTWIICDFRTHRKKGKLDTESPSVEYSSFLYEPLKRETRISSRP